MSIPIRILFHGSIVTIILMSVSFVFYSPNGSFGLESSPSSQQEKTRPRARDLGIPVGIYDPGHWNAITDVAGVKVGQVTLIHGNGRLHPGQGPVRTGVTVIIPRKDVWHQKVPAGAFVLNGTGEMTGLAWVKESGFLEYPIALTNTLNVPRVANGIIDWMVKKYPAIGITDDALTPVVAECDDSRLNDIQGRHVTEHDVMEALNHASSGQVDEGTVGAGTGMISYQFKGGIGTSSRKLPPPQGGYTVGVLVNANHGRRQELMIAGIPVGRLYGRDHATHLNPSTNPDRSTVSESRNGFPQQSDGSIIIIIATDAPLDSRQLTRLSRRAALGLGRTGSISHHGSGDFILAFSTANIIPHYPEKPTFVMTHLADTHINPLFAATVEATEEAILNALLKATTVVGRDARKVEAISIPRLRTILKQSSLFRQERRKHLPKKDDSAVRSSHLPARILP